MSAHIPVRTCLNCRRKRAKREMMRLALNTENGCVVLDGKQIFEGRGAYACGECLHKLRFDKRVQRAFRGAARELCLN